MMALHEHTVPAGRTFCSECGKAPDPSVLRTIGMQYTYGKTDFHGPTVRERAAQTVADARAAGLDPVNVGNRWV